MILLTGAAGFIGSCMLSHLLEQNESVLIMDRFDYLSKHNNWQGKRFIKKVERKLFFSSLESLEQEPISAIIHLGARTDTACQDWSLLEKLNLNFSKQLWRYATQKKIPFLYASSAATYGNGELGFQDNHDTIPLLSPLNLYGKSKQDFDLWALEQKDCPPRWYGFKFFNVYGANEYHKGRMASVIWHTFQQIKKTGEMKLFRSHHADFKDGEQQRDFIYVKDVLHTLFHFLSDTDCKNGIYNLGTGKARTFYDLASSVFKALNRSVCISFIDTPLDIRDTYQYFTEGDMKKMSSQYKSVSSFYTLEDGIQEYVQKYLISKSYY